MDREIKDISAVQKIRLFNTPLEIGFRVLIILRQFDNRTLDLEQLMYLDYLCLNTEDVGGPSSIGAPIPNRGVQVFARKELIQQGLTILLSKELIEFINDSDGFSYVISLAGKEFLKLFSTDYFTSLSQRSSWVFENFGKMKVSELRKFMNENISNWGGEFIS